MSDMRSWSEAKLVRVYRKIREAKDVEALEWKEREKEFDTELDAISSELVERLKKSGQDGFSTEFGSVSKRMIVRAWPSDWDAFKDFVKEYDALDLYEKRVHQGNLTAFIKENPNVVVPVNIDQKLSVTVRKPTTKKGD